MTKIWVLLGVAAFASAGCAVNYVDVTVDEPHATITFQRNLEGVRAVNNEPYQAYELMDNPQCDNIQNVAHFSYDSEFIDTARISAAKKLHFLMHSVPDQNIYGSWCWSYLGFEAENGRDYVVMHESCSPKVYDTSSDEWQAIDNLDIIDGFECPKN